MAARYTSTGALDPTFGGGTGSGLPAAVLGDEIVSVSDELDVIEHGVEGGYIEGKLAAGESQTTKPMGRIGGGAGGVQFG